MTPEVLGPAKRARNGAMDTLESMRVFVRVAQRSSFAAAARELRVSPATVTKHVAALEARVGARLFDRTTRHVGLTEAGRLYLERCVECLQAFDDADASVTALSAAPRGLLRVTAPIDLQTHVSRAVCRFLELERHVTVDLRLSNRAVDLVEEGVDVAIRVAPALEGQFVARPLAKIWLGVVASPEYFRAHGRPKKPEDLERHRALVFTEPRLRSEWQFERGGRGVSVKLNPTITCNGGDAIRTALLEGAGLTVAPSFMVGEELDAGRLEPALLEWRVMPELRLFAVYPHRRFLSPKVRAFVETLRALHGDGSRDPWWSAAPEHAAVAREKSPKRPRKP